MCYNDLTNDLQVHDRERAQALGLVSFAGFRLVSEMGEPLSVLALFNRQAITSIAEKN